MSFSPMALHILRERLNGKPFATEGDEWDRLTELLLQTAEQPHEPGASQASRDVLAERQRQVSKEGWTTEHDDNDHCGEELAQAAAVYANPNPHKFSDPRINHPIGWPSGWDYKPKDRRTNLVRAGALIIAEIERLDRRSLTKPESLPVFVKGQRVRHCDRPWIGVVIEHDHDGMVAVKWDAGNMGSVHPLRLIAQPENGRDGA